MSSGTAVAVRAATGCLQLARKKHNIQHWTAQLMLITHHLPVMRLYRDT